MRELPAHGGPDGGAEPRFDFSSNANSLGPSPALKRALSLARPDLYPDPSYTDLRARLACSRGTTPDHTVVGAGAAELIFRSVLSQPGPVLAFSPSFGEYHRCARALGRECLTATGEDEALSRIPEQGCVFVCLPNNPDGRVASHAFLQEAAVICRQRGTRLVLDLAYEGLCETLPELPVDADWMFAPNKPFCTTGVRAGWMRCADSAHAARLRPLCSAWVVGSEGVALLEWCLGETAQAWLARTRKRLWTGRRAFARELAELGVEVHETPANWLLARSPAPDASIRLLEAGLRVRDTTNMGLADWLRISVQSPAAGAELLETWKRLF